VRRFYKFLVLLVTAVLVSSGLSAQAANIYSKAPTPSISGRNSVNNVLTANLGTWSPQPDYFEYEWHKGNSAGDVLGFQSELQVPADVPLNTKIYLVVKPHLAGYPLISRTSAALVVSRPFSASPEPVIPTSVHVGDQLSVICVDGDCNGPCIDWDYDDSCLEYADWRYVDTWSPKPASLRYQWLRDGQNIKGATSATYVVSDDDASSRLSLKVTLGKSGYETVTYVSNESDSVSYLTYGSTAIPVINTNSGAPVFGEWLTVNTNSWDPEPDYFDYQWFRDGEEIDGETYSDYQVGLDDIGHQLTVAVTPYLDYYSRDSYTSQPTLTAIQATLSTPANWRAEGIAAVGKVLDAKASGWTPKTTLNYQWLRDGEDIQGATKPTYKILADDEGHQLQARVVATKPGYTTVTLDTDPTDPVKAQTFSKVPKFTIKGQLGIGRTLTASTSGLKPASESQAYQWYLDGAEIPDATDATYTTAPSDAGHKLSVKITVASEELASVSQLVTLNTKWPIGTRTEYFTGRAIYDACTVVVGDCSEEESDVCDYDPNLDEDVCLPSGWYSFDPDTSVEDGPTLDAYVSLNLSYEPLSWSAKFVSSYAWYGYFAFMSCPESEDSEDGCDAITSFAAKNARKDRTTKTSKIHDGQNIRFNMWTNSYGTYYDDPVFWFRAVKITYTYYK
jgi:hypothetical protein